MLKLSALQPHLTAAEGLNQQAAWSQGSRYVVGLLLYCSTHASAVVSRVWFKAMFCYSRATREGPRLLRSTSKHVRTQDWHEQGQDLTHAQQPTRQLSTCIQLEVKLAEALDRCDSLSPPQANDDGQLLPNKLRTAVCCKASTD